MAKSPSGANWPRDIAARDLYRATCRYLSRLKLRIYCQVSERLFPSHFLSHQISLPRD